MTTLSLETQWTMGLLLNHLLIEYPLMKPSLFRAVHQGEGWIHPCTVSLARCTSAPNGARLSQRRPISIFNPLPLRA
jgi:hypothetical protein